MINRLPPWLRQEIPQEQFLVKNRLQALNDLRLHTVCQSARCPNIYGCFEDRRLTFMIMGNSCSRKCGFCAVGKVKLSPLNLSEAYNLALSVKEMGSKYVVITSGTRDDLAWGGATQFARTAYLVRFLNPKTRVELLIPDFKGEEKALSLLAKSPVEVIAHNLETVESLYPSVRPQASYTLSLSILEKIRNFGFCGFAKSGIMLGFGERQEEVLKTMRDLYDCGCDIITLGQYLAPSDRHIPVKEFISPETFEFYRREALQIGFKYANSGPLIRSSFKAEEVYSELIQMQ